MEIKFGLASSDWREAQRSVRRFLPIENKVGEVLVIFIGLALLFEPIILGRINPTRGLRGDGIQPLTFAPAVLLGLTLIVVGMFAIKKGRLRRPAHQGVQTVTVDDSGLTIAVDHGQSSQLTWSRIINYVESRNLFLLDSSRWPSISLTLASKYARGFVYIIPKRALAESQVEEFRKMLRENVLEPNVRK
jgi:hypothetical protein